MTTIASQVLVIIGLVFESASFLCTANEVFRKALPFKEFYDETFEKAGKSLKQRYDDYLEEMAAVGAVEGPSVMSSHELEHLTVLRDRRRRVAPLAFIGNPEEIEREEKKREEWRLRTRSR